MKANPKKYPDIAALSLRASGPNPVTFTNAPWDWREVRLGALPDPAKVRGNPFLDHHAWHYGLVGLVVRASGGNCLWLDGAYQSVFEDFADAHVVDAAPRTSKP